MEIVLERKWKKDTYTIGKLYVNGQFFSNTLEDKDRGLTSSMSTDEINKKKVYGETAIPTGTYEVIMTVSGRFAARPWGKKYNGKVPELLNVKGFAGVRIHPGNKATDTLGCILVGKNDKVGMISNSQTYYFKLLDSYIIPTIKKREKIILTIK